MKIEFNKEDLFFEPVFAFFASWIGYHLLFAKEKHDIVSGRLRGFIVPQIEFVNDPLPGKLRSKQDITHLEFQLSNVEPPLPEGEQISSSRLMDFWCQQMTGHAYEVAYPKVADKFGSKQVRKDKWPSEFQFFYHVRNGCFHGNRFDIWPQNISATIETVWRNKNISYDNNGKKVVGEFMGPGDFITLLYDIQKELD